MAVDKELLWKPRLPEREVDVEGVGTVRVRALSMDEVFELQVMAKTDPIRVENLTLAYGMADPAIDEEEAKAWRKAAPPAELQGVLNAISELSGLNEDALKKARGSLEQGKA